MTTTYTGRHRAYPPPVDPWEGCPLLPLWMEALSWAC